jgi:predicted dehydrogenase
MSTTIRVGLIGAGMIGRLRARAVARVPGMRLVAVADAREELARQAAGGVPGVRIFGDGMELAQWSEVDAVILSTPPGSHAPLGLACLAAGKHLLCEKPLATSVAACEALVAAAAKAGVRLATGFNLRYTRAAKLARQLVEAGAIGELDHVRAFHGHGGEEFGHDWVHDAKVTGGGTLMDNGIHVIDLTRWFLGDVRETKGFATGHVWRKAGCEDNGFLVMQNSRGRVATLQSSWSEWGGYGYRIEIYGTEGFVRFGYPPMYLVHGRRGNRGRTRYFFPRYQVEERLRGWEWGLVETLVEDLAGWAAAIGTGSPPPITGEDGLEAVRIARSVGLDA